MHLSATISLTPLTSTSGVRDNDEQTSVGTRFRDKNYPDSIL